MYVCCADMTTRQQFVFLLRVPYDQVFRAQLAFHMCNFYASFVLHVVQPYSGNAGNPFAPNTVCYSNVCLCVWCLQEQTYANAIYLF